MAHRSASTRWMPLYLAEETIDEAAVLISKRLLRLSDGVIHSSEVWLDVSERMCLSYQEYWAPGMGRGEFCPHPLGVIAGGNVGRVAINVAYDDPERARAWVHELSHADICRWFPPQLNEARDAWIYRDNPVNVRHRIAERVEEILFGNAIVGLNETWPRR